MTGLVYGPAIRQIQSLFEGGAVDGLTDPQLLDRFLTRRDGPAFEALVSRHGPMVLATARGVLRDPIEAEDAFQATFLILVRKANSIRATESLGGWLHRVARRVAVQASVEATRRRNQERKAGFDRPYVPPIDPLETEARVVVHEELAKLPDRFRLPVVLCHLEGKTHAEAALELGWGEATVRRRLADARGRLHRRLTRRGVAPSASIPAFLGLAQGAAKVPKGLVEATLRLSTGRAVGASSHAVALAKGVMTRLALSKLRMLSAAAVGLIAVGGLTARLSPSGLDEVPVSRPAQAPQAQPAAPLRPEEAKPQVYQGVVRGPDGKPFAGAAIKVCQQNLYDDHPAVDAPRRAVSGADGRFRFQVEPGDPVAGEPKPGQERQLVASAEGLGISWSLILPGPLPTDFALNLVADDAPIEGRILDNEGRPVAEAEVRLSWLARPSNGSEPFLAAVRNDAELASWLPGDNPFLSGAMIDPPKSVKTGADGRFRMAGLGRERIVELLVRGPSIAESKLMAFTRKMDPVVGPKSNRPQPEPPPLLVVHGSTFDYVAVPTRPITGVVRDKATGQPLAKVRVTSPKLPGRSLLDSVAAGVQTDAEGRFTLLGHPKEPDYKLMAIPEPGSRHLAGSLEFLDTPGLDPIQVEVKLATGIPFRVRLKDQTTGEPIVATGSSVDSPISEVVYHPLHPNPYVQELSGNVLNLGPLSTALRQPDGSYTGVMLPGPGAICVAYDGKKYLRTHVDPWAFFKPNAGPKPKDVQQFGNASTLIIQDGKGTWFYPNDRFQAIVLVNPEPDARPFEADATLVPAGKREVIVLGPDGKPLQGSKTWGADGYNSWSEPRSEARFEILKVDPDHPRRVSVRHDRSKLAGQMTIPSREPLDPKATTTVQLQPWATVSGRLVDANGKPRPGLRLLPFGSNADDPLNGAFTGWHQTDQNGRFRIEGLVPGYRYQLSVMVEGAIPDGSRVFEATTFQPGETRDLADVMVESDRPRPVPVPVPASR